MDCRGVSGIVEVYQGLLRCIRDCRGVSGIVQVYEALSRCIKADFFSGK